MIQASEVTVTRKANHEVQDTHLRNLGDGYEAPNGIIIYSHEPYTLRLVMILNDDFSNWVTNTSSS